MHTLHFFLVFLCLFKQVRGETIILSPVCNGTGNTKFIIDGGESFTAPRTEDLFSVYFYIESTADDFFDYNLKVNLSTEFFGQTLATSTVNVGDYGSTAAWVAFPFPTPAKIIQGTIYYLNVYVLTTVYVQQQPLAAFCFYDVYPGGESIYQTEVDSNDFALQINISQHCGNGRYDPTYDEVCDGVGCSSNCRNCTSGYLPSFSADCTSICGDGLIVGKENCDDGNTINGDGCSSNCTKESGFECLSPGNFCVPICGDGLLKRNPEYVEICDDGNTNNGDGCDFSLHCYKITIGWRCPVPGHLCLGICGDDLVVGKESCDDGNNITGDGCSSNCTVENGFHCPVYGGFCTPICGDGLVMGNTYLREVCDDGNTLNGDGCDYSTNCTIITPGFKCLTPGTLCIELNECELYSCNGFPYTSVIECVQNYPNQRTCICPAGYSGTVTLEGNETFIGCLDIDECSTSTLQPCASTDECINFSPPTCYLCVPASVISTNTIIIAATVAFNSSSPGNPEFIQKLFNLIGLSVTLTVTGWTVVNTEYSNKRSSTESIPGSFGLKIYVADKQALLLTQNDQTSIQTALCHVLKLDTQSTLLTVSTDGILLQQTFPSPLSPSQSTTGVYIAIGVVVGVVILVLVILGILYTKGIIGNKVTTNISLLPNEVRYFWDIFSKRPKLWEQHGDITSTFYSYLIKKENLDDWQRMWQLFTSLGGSEFEIVEAYAIYNEVLLTNAVNQRKIMQTRFKEDPSVFKKTDWKKKDTNGLRSWVTEMFDKLCLKWEWNKNLDLPIIPTIHGTDASIAWKIAQTGFVTLSSLDQGWYGRGIYFTTHAPYTLPYLIKQHPAIVISFCTPGNVYPVIENPTDDENLVGAAQAAGYNSHYVLTSNKGLPHKKKTDKGIYDELVIGQESQVMPAFILLINKTNFKNLSTLFARNVVENDEGKLLVDQQFPL